MSTKKNKALLVCVLNLLNSKQLDAYYGLFDSAYVAHVPNLDISLEITKKIDAGLFSAFPDYHFTIDDVVAEGDKLAFRSTFSGTHTGVWSGVSPTGKKKSFTMFYITRISKGIFIEDWFLTDLAQLMQELGVNPFQYF
jgi:predicted ester cyclase